MIAARVNGPAKTAFPDGKPKKPEDGAEKKDEPPQESLKESKGPINVIVVADVDFLEDRFWTRTQQIEIAKFRDERVQTRKELRKVRHDLQKNIESLKTKLVWANAAAVPVFVLVAGVVVWWMRRKKLAEARARS